MEKILIASGNKGKIEEIKERFNNFDIEFIAQDKFSQLAEVVEDGDSFRENAFKKAHTRSRETGLVTMADDSGLVVEYLNGRPGIYSARFAGENATDEENNRKLLRLLEGVSEEKRKAYFKCVIALVFPNKQKEVTFSGICQGKITEEMRGDNGFGYDPLFYVPEYEKTMAELSLSVKNQISHRARALEEMEQYFQQNI